MMVMVQVRTKTRNNSVPRHTRTSVVGWLVVSIERYDWYNDSVTNQSQITGNGDNQYIRSGILNSGEDCKVRKKKKNIYKLKP